MASYAEYRAKYQEPKATDDDALTTQIDEAAQAQTAREQAADNLPERFAGKTAAEIAASYSELESAYGRQSQTLGDQRKQLDSLLQSEDISQPSDTPTQEVTPVDVDALYEDPDGAIRRVASEVADTRIQELERQIADINGQAQQRELEASHPGYRDTISKPEFADWVREKPYRIRLVQDAEKGDNVAANDVLTMYEESNGGGAEKLQAELDRERALGNATLSSPASQFSDAESEQFSRSDLTEARIAAKLGDPKAEAYLKKNSEAIRMAYVEGRITD